MDIRRNLFAWETEEFSRLVGMLNEVKSPSRSDLLCWKLDKEMEIVS